MKRTWDYNTLRPHHSLNTCYPKVYSTDLRPLHWQVGHSACKAYRAGIKCDSGYRSRCMDSLRRWGKFVEPSLLNHLGPWREIYELLYLALMQENCRFQHVLCAPTRTVLSTMYRNMSPSKFNLLHCLNGQTHTIFFFSVFHWSYVTLCGAV